MCSFIFVPVGFYLCLVLVAHGKYGFQLSLKVFMLLTYCLYMFVNTLFYQIYFLLFFFGRCFVNILFQCQLLCWNFFFLHFWSFFFLIWALRVVGDSQGLLFDWNTIILRLDFRRRPKYLLSFIFISNPCCIKWFLHRCFFNCLILTFPIWHRPPLFALFPELHHFQTQSLYLFSKLIIQSFLFLKSHLNFNNLVVYIHCHFGIACWSYSITLFHFNKL